MKWFFLLSGLVACTGDLLTCPLETNPQMVVVKFQDPITVNCSSKAANIASMGWEAPYGKGVALTKGVSSVLLEVASVTGWEFRPQCYVNFVNGSQCLILRPFTVYKQPDSVTIKGTSQLGLMEEGEKYSLQCDVANVAPARNLIVLWLKAKEVVHTQKFDHSSTSPVDVSSVYTLTAKRGDNGNELSCLAQLNFSPAEYLVPPFSSKPEELIVLYTPTFNKPENEMVEFSTRKNATLDCTATGNPMPVYSWQFPHAIQQTIKNKNENRPILTIDLPGTYTCTATNTQGTKTKSFTVAEAPRNRTTFAALIGAFVALGVVLFILGVLFVTPDGTFSCTQGNYLRGRPASGPV